ncbi:FkbM family methyltransferase [Streptomyces sp. LN325]|uniref:FkbM family methyltransferase n=1 Tax=Streptomyces sp. LN325 TaxID=3112976 RepID=UPI0037210094
MKASRSCFACQRIDSPYYSVLAAHLVGPAGRVAAVEPSPDFHQMLTANARANVRAVNAAASDVPGRLVFYLERSTNLGGTTAVRPHTVESSFEADSASLPQLVTEEELAAARLIKIDVEGAEAAAVSGLVPILPWLRGDAELVIEVTPRLLAKQGRTVDDVLRPLRPDFTPTDWPTTTTPAATQPPCVDLRRRAVARACNGDD